MIDLKRLLTGLCILGAIAALVAFVPLLVWKILLAIAAAFAALAAAWVIGYFVLRVWGR